MYLVILFGVIFTYILRYILLKNKNYWKESNVSYVRPLPLFGNYKDSIVLRKHAMIVAHEICQQFPNEPYIGSFYGTDPALLIQDPEILKLVLTKDFYFFNGREVCDYSHKEVTTRNMFFSSGDYWKVLRTNSTPLFSSAKLKNMFYLIKDCADTLESVLEAEVKSNTISDKRRLLSRFTIDCIVACAFGIRAETLKNRDDVLTKLFTSIADEVSEVSPYNSIKIASRSMWPNLFYALRLQMFPDYISNFFSNLLRDVFKSREATKFQKHDFVDLILTWKQHNCISGDSFSNLKTNEKKIVNINVTDELLVSQCMLFFGAGFDTTANSTSFLLYELAKNQDAQIKVIKEVDGYYEKNQEIEFECITSMPYTELCIQESLRLYPALGLLTREAMFDYTLPTGLKVKKGTRIHIPIYHIHHNPDNFSEPEIFRPERFSEEEKMQIKPYTYLPFGEGPRICLGMRFSKMPTYAALLKIFKNYRVELADGMPKKLNLSPRTQVTQSNDSIRLKFIPRHA